MRAMRRDLRRMHRAGYHLRPRVFVDLDGCLCDFDKGVEDALGVDRYSLKPRALWKRL
eukprot:CAMPEP_0197424512 /NCGR_PEP_ID=MMETSP1170-20131217/26549_1 /TAXON_ID=54406 /ORGANISM="Sarcinochrysis sp, Strain CCMP770" /LENGTH=57 /DNA_ID=CAMNT_0042951995 /DNA_START=9 /DNA_END=179 /DNA_ORIENTATION=+